jgi:hypothetical protein
MGVRTDTADPLKEREDPDEIPLFGRLFKAPVVIGDVKLEAHDLFPVSNNPEVDRFLERRMMRADGNYHFGHFQTLSTFIPP